jgi:hypothetical protein
MKLGYPGGLLRHSMMLESFWGDFLERVIALRLTLLAM